MTLAEIQSSLPVTEGKLILREDDLDVPELNALLVNLPGGVLEVSGPEIVQIGRKLTISGQLDCEWKLVGIAPSAYGFSNIVLTLSEGDEQGLGAELVANGHVRIDEWTVPTVARCASKEPLEVSVAWAEPSPVRFSDVISFGAADETFRSLIPKGVNGLEMFELADLRLTVGSGEPKQTKFSSELKGQADWVLITEPIELTIQSTLAEIEVTHRAYDDDEIATSFSASFGGTMRLDVNDFCQEIKVLLHFNPLGAWTLEVDSENEGGFPPIEALTQIAGGQSLTDAVSSTLQELNLNELAVTHVEVGLDVMSPKLTYVAVESKIGIGGVEIESTMVLPDFSLTGSLAALAGDSEPVAAVSAAAFLQNMGLPPHDLPELAIDSVMFALAPKESSYSIEIDMSGSWEYDEILRLEDLSLALGCHKGDLSCEVTGRIKLLDELDLSLSAKHPGKDEGWQFEGKTNNEFSLSELTRKFAGVDLPEGLPDVIVDDLEVSINTKKQYKLKGKVGLRSEEESTLEENQDTKLKIGDTEVSLASLEFSFANTECSIKICGDNIGAIAGLDIELEKFELAFRYSNRSDKKDWSLGGKINGRIFNHDDLQLSASYKTVKDDKKNVNCIALTYEDKSKQPAIEIPDLFSLEVSKIDIGIDRVRSKGKGTTGWHVQADGALEINNIFDDGNNLLAITGELSLQHDKEGSKLKFAPGSSASDGEAAKLCMPLPIYPDDASKNPSIQLALDQLVISSSKSAKEGGNWKASCSSSVKMDNLPEALSKIINQDAIKITSELKLGSSGIELKVKDSVALVQFDYPVIEAIPEVGLGTGAFGLDELSFKVTKDDIAASGKIKVGLPSELNRLLGKTLCAGEDFELFTVFVPDQPDSSTIDLDVGFGVKDGLTLVPSSSPFKFISIEEKRSSKEDDDGEKDTSSQKKAKSQNKYIYVELEKVGAIGEIELEVPKFSLDTSKGALTAKGGFEIVRDIEIPLTLINKLLERNHISVSLPETIPLRGLEFFDSEGEFQLQSVISEFKKFTGLELSDEIKTLLQYVVESVFDRLPARLKPYLNLTYPKGFHFDVAVTPDGGCKVNLSGHGGRSGDGEDDVVPIRVLIPSVSGILPVLVGIELKSFSFGELLSGLFLYVEADMNLDQFDLLSIIIATIVSDLAEMDEKCLEDLTGGINDEMRGKLSPQQLATVETLQTVSADALEAVTSVAKTAQYFVAAPERLQTTLMVQKLSMLIIYETAIPIPIPLFYDMLGLEITDILGFTVQSHVSFPAPSFSLVELAKTVLSFGKFVTSYDYELPLEGDDVPEDMNLVLSADNNYLELPKFLGGEVLLGAKGKNLEIDAYKTVANLLNAIKKVSLDKIIRAIPYENRVGVQDFSFGPLDMNAKYFLTTSDEVEQGTYKLDGDYQRSAQRFEIDETFKDMASKAIQSFESLSGAQLDNNYSIVFLSGGFGSGHVLDINADFGLIATSSNDFLTGFHFSGKFSDFVALQMSGSAFLVKASETMELAFTRFRMAGDTSLTVATYEIFSAQGEINVEGDSFRAYGQIQGFPPSFPLHAECKGLIQVNKDGTFKLTFDSEAKIQLCGLNVVKGQQSFFLELTDESLHFDAQLRETLSLVGAELDCNFAVDKVDVDQVAMSGSAATKVTLGKVTVVDANLGIDADASKLQVSGQVNMFPTLELIGLDGKIDMLVTQDGSFGIQGDMQASVAGLPLSGGDLIISKERFYLSTKLLGADTELDFSHSNQALALQGHVDLGVFKLTASTDVSRDRVKTELKSQIAGALDLSCLFEARDTRKADGSLSLNLYKMEVFSGNAEIQNGAYSISGKTSLFPTGSPIQFDITSQGALDSRGLEIAGGSSINVLGLFSLAADTKIRNGLPSFEVRVNVLGIECKGSAGLYEYKGGSAFCLTYDIPWLLFIPPMTWYIMISSEGLYGPSTSRPGNWARPQFLMSPKPDHEQEDADIEMPDAHKSMVHLESILSESLDTDRQADKALFATWALYDMDMEIVRDGEGWKRIVTVNRKDDYLDNVQDDIFSIIQDDEKSAAIEGFEFRASKGEFTVVTKEKAGDGRVFALEYEPAPASDRVLHSVTLQATPRRHQSLYEAFKTQVIDKL